MIAAATTTGGYNWYDFVVVGALLFGIVNGIRTGLTREIIRVVGLVLMVVVGLKLFPSVGAWLHDTVKIPVEIGNLIAFVTIAVAIYVVTALVREFVHRKITKFKFGALVENVGGGVAGWVRMLAIMIALTVALCLIRSEYWHEQVACNSKFGSYVADQVPAVAEMAKKHFPEKLWFMRSLKRAPEKTIDEPEKKKAI